MLTSLINTKSLQSTLIRVVRSESPESGPHPWQNTWCGPHSEKNSYISDPGLLSGTYGISLLLLGRMNARWSKSILLLQLNMGEASITPSQMSGQYQLYIRRQNWATRYKGPWYSLLVFIGNGNPMMDCSRLLTDHLPGHFLYPATIKKALIPSHHLSSEVLIKATDIFYTRERLSIYYIPRRPTDYLASCENKPGFFSCTFVVS